MSPYWDQVDTIVKGVDAMRAAGEKYLPRYPNETVRDYEFRRSTAKLTNVYRDVVENLASKPFSHALTTDAEGTDLQPLIDNIDARGNSLHVFAAQVFFQGINRAIDWILVEYPKADGIKTRADEKRAGVRPYWVRIPAPAVLDVQSAIVGGRETITLFRIQESTDRVRSLIHDEQGARFEVFERTENTSTVPPSTTWSLVDQGPLTVGFIPAVPFITGRRVGTRWVFDPPMRDAADLQVELYQQESALKHIKALTCFPMLAGEGITPPTDGDGKPKPVPVGPQAVLYAPPNASGSNGKWTWLVPGADVLRFLAEDVKDTIMQLRELGRQPLTAQSGNLTRITTAVAAQKGNSAAQAWALALKDALELALEYTLAWLGRDTATAPDVQIHTDFGTDALAEQAPDWLLRAHQANELSGQTLRSEFKRFGVLGPDFDEEAEIERLLGEVPGGDE